MTDEELLRAARGRLGILPMDRPTQARCEAFWQQGLMRRDNELPYTYMTQPGVVPDDPEDDDDVV